MDKIFEIIVKEKKRQREQLHLIASENYTSAAVMKAVGSVLMNKYAEGQAGKRFYQGNKFIDEVEWLARERAKKLFKVAHVNVQPYSGSPANSAAEMAMLNPGETLMGLALASGGHLTHGHPKITFSGRFFNSVQYTVGKDGWLDYEAIKKLAKKAKPKLIICGTTAYPRILDWKKFREIADAVGAYLMADMAHIAGLVAGGVHPSPSLWVDVITTTTHKTLRGPRGAMIMVTKRGLKKYPDLADKIDRAVFPGLQGGPHMQTIAGIAVALREAAEPKFKNYAKQIVKNAKVLAKEFKQRGYQLVSGGTDNHLMLIDLRNKGVNGVVAAWALEYAGIILNYNSVPFDTNPPFYPSGIRLGTPILTTRGMKEKEMIQVADWIDQAINLVRDEQMPVQANKRAKFLKEFKVRVSKNKELAKIKQLVAKFGRKWPV
ncbi:MAG: serine hydroxymethyltransferase [Patescibacteria group bacterium]|nr:serine hydroxymethyltransferase [Patescibacteria group bacterium]